MSEVGWDKNMLSEEVLASIRTVVSFGGQKKELENYSEAIKEAKRHSIIKGDDCYEECLINEEINESKVR